MTAEPAFAKMLMPATRRALDRQRGVVAPCDPARGRPLGDVVGVLRLAVHREAALGQPAERADEIGRHAADEACAHEHRVDVPVGVVVGEDRLAEILLPTRCLEVARRGEDRVDRVVRVLLAVAVGVDSVQLPAGGDELHPPDRAGAGDVEVAAVVRLDLVDRGEDLPRHAVLDAGGLVDRQQEHGDAELVDEEVRNADRHGARECQGHGRVLQRRECRSGSAASSSRAGAVCTLVTAAPMTRPAESSARSPARGTRFLLPVVRWR